MSHRSFFHSSVRPGACALSAAALLAVGVGAPAHAEWRWRDEKNRTHMSDRPPPPSVPESAILKRPPGAMRQGGSGPQFAAPAASAASAPSGTELPASGPFRGVDPELEARRKKAEQDEASKRKAEDAKVSAARADNCARAQAALRTLDSGMRMAKVNEKGEREIMDDAARAADAKRARDVVASDCNKP